MSCNYSQIDHLKQPICLKVYGSGVLLPYLRSAPSVGQVAGAFISLSVTFHSPPSLRSHFTAHFWFPFDDNFDDTINYFLVALLYFLLLDHSKTILPIAESAAILI